MKNCQLRAAFVYQMEPGDTGAIPLWALWADMRDRPYVAAGAPLEMAGCNVEVRRDEDGQFHADLSRVPEGHRFERVHGWVPSYRVHSVSGGEC